MRLAWLAVGAWLAASGASPGAPGDAQAAAHYLNALDLWVKNGGPVSEVQSRVVDNCTKLALTTVDLAEWAALMTKRRDELNFRIDICVKATIHRVRPQPEFSNPMFVEMVCRDSKVLHYRELCSKAHLQPNGHAI
jgi:hypothetical protein